MSGSILTVTLNAAVDKTYTVPGFCLDRVHRPTETRVTAGGKGINVARVYQTLGGVAVATGFLGGVNGDDIARRLSDEGIASDFVRVSGESRVCFAIMDPLAKTLTELNENGPRVTSDECRSLFDRLRELLPGRAAVILSGSLPPGASSTLYRDIIRLAQEECGVRAVLDSSGDALARGVEAGPYLVKPNQAELAALGIPADDLSEAVQTLRRRFRVPLAMVTAGGRGAVIAGQDGVWEAVPPAVRTLSAVGSGDALTAAFVWSWLRGDPPPQSLRMGVAAGAANVMTFSAGFLDSQPVFHLAGQTRIRRIG